MQHVISKIERQPNHKSRYNIYVDGVFILSVHADVLVKYQLSKGQMLPSGDWHTLLLAEEENKARQTAVKLIHTKPRTTAEMKRRLTEKGFANNHISTVLSWLTQYGYLNDQAYAEAWVEERRRVKGYGIHMLRHELEQKGVESHWIEAALSSLEDRDDFDLALEWACKRYERLHHLDWPVIKRRIGTFLQRKGYSFEVVMSVLEEIKRTHVDHV